MDLYSGIDLTVFQIFSNCRLCRQQRYEQYFEAPGKSTINPLGRDFITRGSNQRKGKKTKGFSTHRRYLRKMIWEALDDTGNTKTPKTMGQTNRGRHRGCLGMKGDRFVASKWSYKKNEKLMHMSFGLSGPLQTAFELKTDFSIGKNARCGFTNATCI